MLKYFKINVLIILSFLIFISSSKDLIQLDLKAVKRGSLMNNEYDYYILTLPNEIDKDNYLILELEPNKNLDQINNIISDPNLYVSINEQRPSVTINTWKSERFGDETISIDPSYIIANQNFYIAVHCNEKCNYILKAQLVKNIILKEDGINYFNLNAKTVSFFTFTTRSHFNELNINVIGSYINSFSAYLKREHPYSSNSLPSIPILFNGYRFNISKYNILQILNTNAKFNLIIDNEDNNQDLMIWLQYDNENILIKEAEILYDSIDENKAHCYNYPIDYFNKDKDIIISASLFNGEGFLYMAGFNSINADSIKMNDKYKDSSYSFIQSKAIKLTEEDFKKFGQYNENGQTFLNFCFFATKNASLSLKTYFLENYKRLQALNIIYPGVEIEDIIPGKSLKKYKIEHFDIKQDVFIFLMEKSGNSKLYLFMAKPEEENIIIDKKDFETLKKSNNVIEGNLYHSSYYLYLTKESNKCIKNKNGVYSCYLSVVVECQSEDDCSYNIWFDQLKKEINMKPKQIYTNVISENEYDSYKIIITDPSIKNLVIVLMQNTGKALLRLTSFTSEAGALDLNEDVQNNEFLPNLIKISSEKLKVDSLKGTFSVKVKGLSYASYSLYYYTYDKDENENALEQDKVTMKLEKGRIIRDIFLDNHTFKVYLYDSSIIGKKSSLFIGLVETSFTNLELYVFKDLNDFAIYNKIISGYLWKGDYKDFIYIDKNDKNYLKYDIFYILVYKKNNYLINDDKNAYTSFYLGITDETTPLLLDEGLEFKHQLNQEHNSQTFYYYFLDEKKEEDLHISLSLFYGHIMIKIEIENKIYEMNHVLEESTLITIKRENIYQYCKKDSNCGISIEISNDNSFLKYSSFLISVRSSSNTPINLKQGLITKRTILTGEEQHFIVDLKPDKKFGARIITMFTNGQGEIYVRRLLRTEIFEINSFPDENNYEYMMTYRESKNDFYIIEIPYSNLGNQPYYQLLITVRGVFPGIFNTKIEYSIYVSSSIYDIETDKNYKLFISQGEVAIFHFKVGINKKRLYISMTNKEKDANMFLTNQESIENIFQYEWRSSGGYNEYIDLSINDPYFVERGMEDLDGNYYLAIQGIENTFYNLYISTQDVKIITLSQGSPGGCICEAENDYCYFRYENFDIPQIANIGEKIIIFYTEFTYGSGAIQAKLYKNGDMEEILNNLPSSDNNDVFMDDSSEYLIMNIDEENQKYTINSVIVVGVQCKEKSLFDLSAVLLDTNTDIARAGKNILFLKSNQDNIFYLSKITGLASKFIYYIYDEEDVNFHVRGLTCSAELHTYTNKSIVDYKFIEGEDRNTSTSKYHHISDFFIDSDIKGKNEYFGIVSKNYGFKKYFYIEVKPLRDCLINININYNNEIIQVPLNKEIVGIISDDHYDAYYDFSPEIDEIIITVTSLDNKIPYNVYLKTNIININAINKNDNENKYSKASSRNYDLKGKTNELTSAISLRIKNAPRTMRTESHKVRIYINIVSPYYSNGNKVKILVTPVMNNSRRIKPEQNIYYFSAFENYTEKAIFNLKKSNKDDDLMIIEISSCKGFFTCSLTDTPPLDNETYAQLQMRRIPYQIYSYNGKKIITVENLNAKEYYLTVFGSKFRLKDIKIFLDEKENEGNDVDILFYYYTTKKSQYNYLVTNDFLIYESKDNSIKFYIPELKKRDAFGKDNYVDSMNYTLLISDEKKDYLYMESICYLAKMQQNNQNNKFNFDIEYDDKNKEIRVKGLKGGKAYYMNILGKNLQTGEVITYKPMVIILSTTMKKIKVFIIIFLVIAFIVVLYVAFTFYRKYRIEKIKLNFVEENNNSNDDDMKKKISKLGGVNLDFIKKNDSSVNDSI